MPTWIKICATTCVEDAVASITAGADALGFVFASSPRQISANQARQIVQQVPANIETIGVFRNESVERVAQVVEEAQLTGVQLHGEETAAFILLGLVIGGVVGWLWASRESAGAKQTVERYPVRPVERHRVECRVLHYILYERSVIRRIRRELCKPASARVVRQRQKKPVDNHRHKPQFYKAVRAASRFLG